MGILLYLASFILQIILVPAGVIFGIIYSFYDTHIGNGLSKVNAKFKFMAIGSDIFGNIYCEELFNVTLITKATEHKFGSNKDTISQVLGYNLLKGTLTKTGKGVVKLLDLIEKDHCLKAIKQK